MVDQVTQQVVSARAVATGTADQSVVVKAIQNPIAKRTFEASFPADVIRSRSQYLLIVIDGLSQNPKEKMMGIGFLLNRLRPCSDTIAAAVRKPFRS